MASFPVYVQHDAMDCGPTCLRMIARYYGKNYSLQTLREKCQITKDGVTLLGISDAAESLGFRTVGVSVDFDKLQKDAPLPVIVHWKQNHFIVVYKITKNNVTVGDPAFGLIRMSRQDFLKGWISIKENNLEKGLALLLEPKPEFYSQEGEVIDKKNLGFLLSYLKPYRKFVVQLVLGILAVSLLLLIFPFLTQAIVDYGINNQDIPFIYLILASQLVLVLSRQSVEFIRGWILLHLSSRINISLISDFLLKLMRLPISFFDTKMVGDLLQRIGDHRRIEYFLTGPSLEIFFSIISLIIFSIVLGIYSIKILLIFVLGSLLYFFWINFFMKRRRELDFLKFKKYGENQGKLIQMIYGVEEIKLNGAEKQKRWEWEDLQASLFKINIRALSISQYQMAGATLINEVKNIIITVLTATAVVNGQMTLGMMLAVSYILGQLNSPIERMVSFLSSAQDARLSLERLGEIHELQNEETTDSSIHLPPAGNSIELRNLSFKYDGPVQKMVLKNLNLNIPERSVTAIVGNSGSGKTTLIKLLLGYYAPADGDIRIGDQGIKAVNKQRWRDRCGVVLQSGYIFSDTIARNIALGNDSIDMNRLREAAEIANISEFIDQLPLGFNTKLGSDGQSLSGGEKQRILIARAVYKEPEVLFLDEGTSSLDANNEKAIMEKLNRKFRDKTMIIVAHRLSTVMNADQIVVLENGSIVETGNHKELSLKKGHYYQLVRNQLEMGV